MSKIHRMLRALASLRNPRTWGPFVETAEATGFDHAFTISWSQAGEDIALALLLGSSRPGRYLDIGAHDPSRFSVTRKLYAAGWSGVNVDANRLLIERFVAARPRDVNIVAAVGDKSEYDFTVFEEPAISTVSGIWEARFIEEGQRIVRRDKVRGLPLRAILDEHFPHRGPELLSIDVEGVDAMALRSAHFDTLKRHRWPEWILLETSPPVAHALSTEAVAYAQELGFEAFLVLPMATLLHREVGQDK